MKKYLSATIGILLILKLSAQEPGIHFEQGLSWKQIQAKAKKENKFVFVDCYATWCGPCKYMAKNIFPLKETGDAVNPKFISVGMQLDSTKNDSDSVKRGYADAHEISVRYKIKAYPTFLFFNPKGELVHHAVGSAEAVQFIGYTQDALQPEKQYTFLVNRFRKGQRDTTLLESLASAAIMNGDTLLCDSAMKDWLSQIRNPYTKERIDLIAKTTFHSGDPGFDLFFKNAEKVDGVETPGFANKKVTNIIISENHDIMALVSDPSLKPDWDKIYNDINAQFGPAYAQSTVTWVKVPYYKMVKNWDMYGKSLAVYLKEASNNMQHVIINNYAWDIFEYCTSPEDLEVGITAMNQVLTGADNKNPGYMDTYANLLYKSGKTADAITVETEALSLIDNANKKGYQETLDKMKVGTKTWN